MFGETIVVAEYLPAARDHEPRIVLYEKGIRGLSSRTGECERVIQNRAVLHELSHFLGCLPEADGAMV